MKSMYKSNKIFGGLYIIFSGYFIQIEVFGNTSICKSLYIST